MLFIQKLIFGWCSHLPMRYGNSQCDHPACLFFCFIKRFLRGPVRAPRQTIPEAIKTNPEMTNCAPLGAIASAFAGRAPSPKPQRRPSNPQGEPIVQVDGPPPSPNVEWNRMYGGMSVLPKTAKQT